MPGRQPMRSRTGQVLERRLGRALKSLALASKPRSNKHFLQMRRRTTPSPDVSRVSQRPRAGHRKGFILHRRPVHGSEAIPILAGHDRATAEAPAGQHVSSFAAVFDPAKTSDGSSCQCLLRSSSVGSSKLACNCDFCNSLGETPFSRSDAQRVHPERFRRFRSHALTTAANFTSRHGAPACRLRQTPRAVFMVDIQWWEGQIRVLALIGSSTGV